MLGWRLRIGGFGEEPGQRNEGAAAHCPTRLAGNWAAEGPLGLTKCVLSYLGRLEVVLSPLVFQLNPCLMSTCGLCAQVTVRTLQASSLEFLGALP